ncbi:MAG: rare lipoprotein [Acidobacteriota bacterium]|nr:rare lipoprotein [Acidobacteriota bacterium]
MLETVKGTGGTVITAKEAAAIQKIGETVFKENVFQSGVASWYGRGFHGKRTASGEIYDMHKLTAAHKSLPFNSLVEVENLDNGKRVIVRINDRGPFLKDRIIDLSYDAAKKLAGHDDGIIPVALRIVKADAVTPTVSEHVSTATPTDQQTTSQGKIEKEDTQAGVEVPQVKIYLQVGAFSEKDNALKMLKNLKLILADVSFDIYFQDGLYKVISFPLPSRTRAEELKKALKDINIDAFIKEQ